MLLKSLPIYIILIYCNALDFDKNATDITELVMAVTAMNDTISSSTNSTENTTNIDLLRITKPSTNLNLLASSRKDNIENITNSKFTASPQLETYIEYNRFPVRPENSKSYLPPNRESSKIYTPPKMTQAKIRPSEQVNENNFQSADYYLNTAYDVRKASTTENSILPTAQDKQLIYPLPMEKPIRFDPYYHPHVVYPMKPVVEHPYPFVVTDLMRQSVIPAHVPIKFVNDFNIGKSGFTHPPMMSPWKRAAKIFATILPIGLLISALTPNILTISSINETNPALCRKLGRNEEDNVTNQSAVKIWSKPGCEARLLCETAIKKDEIDAETIKKLFWTFVSQNSEDSQTPEELEAVSKAIREKRCEQIKCRYRKFMKIASSKDTNRKKTDQN